MPSTPLAHRPARRRADDQLLHDPAFAIYQTIQGKKFQTTKYPLVAHGKDTSQKGLSKLRYPHVILECSGQDGSQYLLALSPLHYDGRKQNQDQNFFEELHQIYIQQYCSVQTTIMWNIRQVIPLPIHQSKNTSCCQYCKTPPKDPLIHRQLKVSTNQIRRVHASSPSNCRLCPGFALSQGLRCHSHISCQNSLGVPYHQSLPIQALGKPSVIRHVHGRCIDSWSRQRSTIMNNNLSLTYIVTIVAINNHPVINSQ